MSVRLQITAVWICPTLCFIMVKSLGWRTECKLSSRLYTGSSCKRETFVFKGLFRNLFYYSQLYLNSKIAEDGPLLTVMCM